MLSELSTKKIKNKDTIPCQTKDNASETSFPKLHSNSFFIALSLFFHGNCSLKEKLRG